MHEINSVSPYYCKCKIHTSGAGKTCQSCGVIIKPGLPTVVQMERWIKEGATP